MGNGVEHAAQGGDIRIVKGELDALPDLTCWELTPKDYADQEQVQLKTLETRGQYGPYEKHYIR